MFKATMIVSGGLSSTIAGENFFQGFKQGVIVAGLNHLAHLTADSFDEKGKLYIADKPDAAVGMEHVGIMGGNEAHGYRFTSIQGDDTVLDLDLKTDGHQPYDKKYSTFDSEGEDITFKTEKTALAYLKSVGYTKIFSIEVSYKTVGIVLNEVVRFGTSAPYSTLFRNCADGIISGLKTAGLPFMNSYSGGTLISIPMLVYNDLANLYNIFYKKTYNPTDY